MVNFIQLIAFLFILSTIPLVAQQAFKISGTVMDASNKTPVALASISVKSRSIGALTDNDGYFELKTPIAEGDSLVVIAFGYKTRMISLASFHSPLMIILEPVVIELNEVVVRPEEPTYFINRVMKNIIKIRADFPYQALGSYKEKVWENGKVLRDEEGIFRSYNFLRNDSVKKHFQLIHYQEGPEKHPMEFMKEERDKMERKEYEKKEVPPNERLTGLDFVFLSGGPPVMMRYVSINKSVDDYLDSTQFKKYEYYFYPSEGDTLIIGFKSKGVVNHARKTGKIYIHLPTNSLLKIEGSGELTLPTMLKPLMFLYGFSTQRLSFSGVKHFEMVRGRWFFKSAKVQAWVSVTKKRWFDANEHADFQGDQSYTVYELKKEGISPIDPTKRFNPERRMRDQVFKE